MNIHTLWFRSLAGWLLMPALSVSAEVLTLTDCALEAADRSLILEAQCGQLRLAENPQQPEGRQISLSFAVVPARSREPAADPIVYFAGGPGQSASESFHLIHPVLHALNRKRPLWILDQRGTGRSEPLRCDQPVEQWIKLEDSTAIEFAQACRQALEAQGRDLRWYGTTEAIQDLEQLRLAMGAPRLNLIAGSYGTRVAQAYMRRYPGSVRTAVLDGVVPPGLALGQEHALNLERALDLQAAHCHSRPACAERFGSLRASLTQLMSLLQGREQVVTVASPRTGEPMEVPLSADTLAAVVRLFSYGRDSASLLPLVLDEARQGRPQMLASQAAILLDAMAEGIYHGMQLSVSCSEDMPRLRADPDDAQRVLGGALTHFMRLQCAQWPTKPIAADFHEPVRVDVPTLLLSGEWDPVTPPSYGDIVAAELPNARHLVLPGQGHIVMRAGCMPELIEEFVSVASSQSLQAECLDSLGPPAVFLSTTGTAP